MRAREVKSDAAGSALASDFPDWPAIEAFVQIHDAVELFLPALLTGFQGLPDASEVPVHIAVFVVLSLTVGA